MTDIVDETLSGWRQSQFVWGKSDCLLSLADYVIARGGVDAGAGIRGTYDTEATARAIVDAHGGAAALIDRTGLPRVAVPARGDLVLMDCGGDHIGALCTGRGVAARRERGTAEIDLRFVKVVMAWAV